MIIELPNLVGGMNTNVDPLRVGLNQASMLRNCDIKGEEIRMSKGTESFITSLGTGKITGMFPFTTTDGSISQLIFGWGTKLYYITEEDGTPVEIATGLTDGAIWEAVVFDDELRWVNESDDLYGKWTGLVWSTTTLAAAHNIPDKVVDITTGEGRVVMITKKAAYASSIEDADDFQTGNSFVTGTGAFGSSDGDYLTACYYWKGKFFFFKNRSIWRLVFDSAGEAGGLEPISNSVGCVAKRSIAERDGLILFLSESGVQMLDPSSETIVQGDFAGLLSRDISAGLIDDIVTPSICAGHYYAKEGRYVLAINQGTTNSLVVNQYHREAGLPWTLKTGWKPSCFCEFEGEFLYGDDVNGIIYKMEQDDRDYDGSAIVWEIQFTKDINDQGEDRVETDKVFDALRIEAIVKANTIISTEISTNFHSATQSSFTFDASVYTGEKSNPLGQGQWGVEPLGGGRFQSFDENQYVHKRIPIGKSGSYVKVKLSNQTVGDYVSILGLAFEIQNLETPFLA